MSEDLKVRFEPSGYETRVSRGANLLKSAMDLGLHINASCGGSGVCGKCRVIVEEGEVELVGGLERLTDEDMAKGVRLACQSEVKADLVVRVPVESQLDRSVLKRRSEAARAVRALKPFDPGEFRQSEAYDPVVKKFFLKLAKPTLTDNVNDLARLTRQTASMLGGRVPQIDLGVLRGVPDTIRAADWEVTVTVETPPGPEMRPRIIRVEPGDTSGVLYGIAVDIGTTTVAAELIDLNTCEILDREDDYNAQISYGEDVITRIIYASKEGGLGKMQELVVGTINGLISGLLETTGVKKEDVSVVVAAGNTTMTSLFTGVQPRYLRESPYVPPADLFSSAPASFVGLDLAGHTVLHTVPGVSSYVGGDVVAGVIASGMWERQDLTLFIDLGTNGEIVMGNQDWMASASCSAGPAFEGGGIKFGMRATSGAIEDIKINPQTFEPMSITIGMKKAKGICGSAIINGVAEFLESCVIDQNGKFLRDLNTDRVRPEDHSEGSVYEFVLAFKENTQLDEDITLTEIDVENLMRAKGAMYAGYQTLLNGVGLTMDALDRVIIAGGFGHFINAEKAATIGLLPDVPAERVSFIGNGSLRGARINLLSTSLMERTLTLARSITNFELSESPGYMDAFMAAMFFPHTDMTLFPTVEASIKTCRERVMKLREENK